MNHIVRDPLDSTKCSVSHPFSYISSFQCRFPVQAGHLECTLCTICIGWRTPIDERSLLLSPGWRLTRNCNVAKVSGMALLHCLCITSVFHAYEASSVRGIKEKFSLSSCRLLQACMASVPPSSVGPQLLPPWLLVYWRSY